MLAAVGPVTKILRAVGLIGRMLFLFLSSTTDLAAARYASWRCRIAGDDIHPNGCERYIYSGIEHAKFEARAKRASQGAINVCFGDEAALRWLRESRCKHGHSLCRSRV